MTRAAGYAAAAAALEALVARGLLPPHWTDAARAPRWWCDDHDPRDEDHDAPPSLPALVAVAALGVVVLARAEATVAETWRGARLVWRVESAAGLCSLLSAATDEDAAARLRPCVVAFALEWRGVVAGWSGRDRWPVAPPADVMGLAPCESEWSALRALAALGLCLLALDAARVVLGCESIGAEVPHRDPLRPKCREVAAGADREVMVQLPAAREETHLAAVERLCDANGWEGATIARDGERWEP